MIYRRKIDFSAAGSYTNAGATGAVVYDATKGVLAVTAPINTTTRARVTTAVASAMPLIVGSDFGAFRLVFNTDLPSAIKTLSVYISMDTAYAVSGYFKVGAGNFILGRNEVVLGWDDFVPPAGKTANDFQLAQMLRWQVNLSSSLTEAAAIELVSFDGIERSRGGVVIMADDALAQRARRIKN